ncbi:MAG: Phage portal protein HK97 family [Rhodospirillaceae bacterium]|nr:MAG: Phage portal protein HK97 family [Rhodospirillaceae bacterium]
MAKKHRKAAKREQRERVDALRRAAELRDPDAQRLPFVGRTLAGVYVTGDNALQLATVWACLRYLTQTIGMLPWNVMASTDGKGAEVQRSNPVQWLLHNRPNDEWSSFQFRETLLHWALRHGNGYAEIERDRAGRPYALWPVHPDRVDPTRDLDTNKLFFRVDNGSGEKVDIAAADMFHLRGFGEGPVGVNVMAYAAQSLGWAKALQLFGASFFGNGANISGVVTKKRKFDPGSLARVKTEFSKLYKGLQKSNQTAFLDDEMDFKPTGVDPSKAQMIEANYLMIEETCRWFGVPPHKVAHLLRATFSNIEHQSIEVVQDSVLPWVRRLEDEADYKLFGQNRQGLYTKIELRGLLRGDFKSQQEGLEVMRRNGIINADQWLELVDMPPMPADAGGDKRIVQSQYITLDKVGEDPPAPPPPRTAEDEAAAQAEIDKMAEEDVDVA